MEFDETPDGLTEELARLREKQGEIAEALSEIMVGLVDVTGWMTAGGGD